MYRVAPERWLAFLLALLAPRWCPAQTAAPPVKPHEHRIIEVYGQPILTMLSVKLERPRRIVRDARGNLFIADSALGRVLRVDNNGKSRVLAAGLSEPYGLCLDKAGRCYVVNRAGGERRKGNVVRIETDGRQRILAKGLTGPEDVAFGPGGRLYVAVAGEDRIVTIEKGRVRQFARNVSSPSAVCFGPGGNLLVSSSVEGTLTRITPQGKASRLCEGLSAPSDIAVGPQGEIVVANLGGTQLTLVKSDGRTSNYMSVPRQTVGLCFDRQGNLVVLNREKGWAVRATIRLWVPCPHCNKKIPLRIKPRNPDPASGKKVF